MIDLLLILKGFLIGLAKIIPGVSGSLLAVSMGLYDKGIDSIAHFFKNFKNNLIFLGNIGIGILCAIVLGSGIIGFFLEYYSFATTMLFLGFIIGTFPSLCKDTQIHSKYDILIILAIAFIFVFLTSINGSSIFKYDSSFSSNLFVFVFGFIDAATMVIPGISGTAIFMILGCYSFVLELFASPMNGTLFSTSFVPLLVFGCGVLLGAIVVSRCMAYALAHYRKKTYLVIFGLALSSILILFLDMIQVSMTLMQIFIGFFFCTIGYLLSSRLNNM